MISKFSEAPPYIYMIPGDDGHNDGFLILHKTDKIWLDTKKKKNRLKQMLNMDSLVKRIIIVCETRLLLLKSPVNMDDNNRTLIPTEIDRKFGLVGQT